MRVLIFNHQIVLNLFNFSFFYRRLFTLLLWNCSVIVLHIHMNSDFRAILVGVKQTEAISEKDWMGCGDGEHELIIHISFSF